MRTVWKYELSMGDEVSLEMPAGAQILTAQTKNQKPCIWAMVDPAASKVVRRFRIAGTGHRLDDQPMTYVDTFQLFDGSLVFHLFELP